jgi:hypothetical protein
MLKNKRKREEGRGSLREVFVREKGNEEGKSPPLN